MNRFRPLGGAALATAGVAFFAGQFVVQSAWTTPFSWADNTISDLGTAESPWHALMNTVFVANGVLVAIGALLSPRGRAVRALLLGVAAGSVLVGLVPSDAGSGPGGWSGSRCTRCSCGSFSRASG
ncbi:DUF998 domain-containing protein [Cryptosporangium sp. NPDC051539]|uniref:DUF998 domain-containing protein n=1 Tax=Cryptosporangium sp. NPDC051539 TaxID=3363962 RepID=UPI00379C1A35